MKPRPGLIPDPNNPQTTATALALKKRRANANAKLKLTAAAISDIPADQRVKLPIG